jgi:transcriptional regulator
MDGAHRFSLELKLGRRLNDKEQALHTCDTPKCVNPRHLFLGSNHDNRQDMAHKMQSGITRGKYDTKLTKKQVKEIRNRYTGRRGEMKLLAEEFGVTSSNIFYILKGKSWRHTKGKVFKGRIQREPFSKEEKVQIQRLREQGHTPQELAIRFGTTYNTIRSISRVSKLER